MILLDILGGKKSERSICEDAFWFALKTLMPNKKRLDVEIMLTNIPDDADGYHLCTDKYTHTIEIQKGQNLDDLLTCLFHEMVHVRQAERGQLIDSGFTKTWEGIDYISIFSTIDEYRKLPWEAEAYRLQEELLVKWKKNTK